MRILLAANASYGPRAAAPRAATWSGSTAWRAPATSAASSCGASGAGAELRASPVHRCPARWTSRRRRVQTLRRQIREFQPDWVLVSSEDLGHGLLREAHHSRARPRGLPGPHAAVLSLRAGELESRRACRRTGGAGGRHRGHRPPHGGIHRARAGPPGRGDPSADLRRAAVSGLRRQLRCAAWSP